MRKRTQRKPVVGLNPFEKARILQAWRADHVKASIHALIGDDVGALVRQAGGVVYGVIFASESLGLDADDADVCAVRNAAKALVEQSSLAAIDESLRARVVEGLAACERLLPRLGPASLHRAVYDVIKVAED